MPDPTAFDQYRSVITVGAFALFAIAWWLWRLDKQIEDGCAECAHCRERRRVRDQRQAELQEWYGSNLGLGDHPDVKRRWSSGGGDRARRARLPSRLRRLWQPGPRADHDDGDGPVA